MSDVVSTVNLANIQDELRYALRYLYENFVKGEPGAKAVPPDALSNLSTLNTNISPAASSRDTLYTFTAKQDNLFINSLDFGAFRSSYAASATSENLVKVRTTAGPGYVAASSGPTWADVVDINVADALTTLGGTGPTALRDAFDMLKIAYQMCDDAVFPAFQSEPRGMVDPATIGKIFYYRLSASPTETEAFMRVNPDGVMDNETALTGLRNNPMLQYLYNIDPVHVDIFVLRRILLGTYYALHCRLFLDMYIYQKSLGAAGAGAVSAKCLEFFYKKLRTLNTDYESSVVGSSASPNPSLTAMQSLQNNMQEYHADLSALNQLDVTIGDSRRSLKTNMDAMHKRDGNSHKAFAFRVVAIVLASLVSVALLAVLVLPADGGARVKAAAVVMAVGVALAGILMVARPRFVSKEGFAVNLPSGSSFETVIAGLTTDEQRKQMFDLVVLSELNDYYKNTLTLAMALRTNSLYNTLNYNQKKELLYFNDNASQLQTAVTGADAIGKLYVGRTKVSTAIFVLCIGLLLLIGAAVLILLTTEQLPLVRQVGHIVTGVAAALLVVWFCNQLLSRVRSDPQKRYWGTPPAAATL